MVYFQQVNDLGIGRVGASRWIFPSVKVANVRVFKVVCYAKFSSLKLMKIFKSLCTNLWTCILGCVQKAKLDTIPEILELAKDTKGTLSR